MQRVPNEDVNKYGIINANIMKKEIYKVTDMIEKPSQDKAPSNIAILGRYIITPRFLTI